VLAQRLTRRTRRSCETANLPPTRWNRRCGGLRTRARRPGHGRLTGRRDAWLSGGRSRDVPRRLVAFTWWWAGWVRPRRRAAIGQVHDDGAGRHVQRSLVGRTVEDHCSAGLAEIEKFGASEPVSGRGLARLPGRLNGGWISVDGEDCERDRHGHNEGLDCLAILHGLRSFLCPLEDGPGREATNATMPRKMNPETAAAALPDVPALSRPPYRPDPHVPTSLVPVGAPL
jgi:hypothetical protein